jgi:hypothetical protein
LFVVVSSHLIRPHSPPPRVNEIFLYKCTRNGRVGNSQRGEERHGVPSPNPRSLLVRIVLGSRR